jgi:hypothetical protein
MRGKPPRIHRLCVNRYTAYAWKSRRIHAWNVDIRGELLQLFRLGFGGVVGGKAATAN